MKYILHIFTIILVSILFITNTYTATNSIFTNTTNENPYKQNCTGGDCLKEGLDSINDIKAIETEKTASEYIQDIVKYILTFVTLIAVILIIYSGFVLLTGLGEEEKIKKAKQIIIYSILGIIVIYLAGPITNFVLLLF